MGTCLIWGRVTNMGSKIVNISKVSQQGWHSCAYMRIIDPLTSTHKFQLKA